ncbi:hypothetical protein GCM10010420_45500 [Streptomyces glaucosporus]|uniref:N-acetyltransferase domain-containing protein n=1 Tax=Streptomyces glaucosporus TaxID=284044 RepID=A0ABN3IQZ4_9ACTN
MTAAAAPSGTAPAGTAVAGTSAGVAVRPVRGRADATAFVALPRALYRGDPHWVAPLERDQRALLDRRRNPFFDVGAAEFFLARRGRRVVGRIAAAVDCRLQARHDPHCGVFGFFECADDPGAAAALFDAAAAWLRERGLRTMLGPMGFSTNDECGVLVEGFDGPPSVMMPYNHPYYPALYTACGLVRARDLLSWRVPMPPGGDPPPVVARAAEWALQSPDVRVRPLDPARMDDDLAAVREIYTEAWTENYASVPLTGREFAHTLRRLRPLIRPELLWFAEVRGEPVAFTLWLPDANQALRAARGRLTTFGVPVGLLRIALAFRRVDRTRAIITGIKEAHRSRGLGAALVAEAQRAAFRLGYTESELSWLLEDNRDANRYAEAFGGVLFRRHRLYRRGLVPAPPPAGEAYR